MSTRGGGYSCTSSFQLALNHTRQRNYDPVVASDVLASQQLHVEFCVLLRASGHLSSSKGLEHLIELFTIDRFG